MPGLALTSTPARADRHIVLPTGSLDVRVRRARWPLDALCDFAARDNPRRGFLVVSKLLGRHIGAAPEAMRRSVRDLALAVPDDLPGPVLVVGLAETAICLAQMLHEELRARSGRDDILFIHSTRQVIDHPVLCRFDEPHSHASGHLIYRPDIPGFASPRSLVLVDDEVSTGTTLINLARALTGSWPGIEAIRVASLTDWSDGGWLSSMPRPGRSTALLEGSLDWTPGTAVPPSAAFDRAANAFGRMTSHINLGRLGLCAPLALSFPEPPPGSAPLRVLGTGECSYPAFALAEHWQGRGRDVVVQATSRSPTRIGGAMRTALRFADNYATGVPNYLYNADPGDGRETWIVAETGAGSIDPALVKALSARVLAWPA